MGIVLFKGFMPVGPVQIFVRPYYVLEIEVAERVYRYMIYEEHGTVYAEVPYEGVYRIDGEAIYLLK